MPARFFLDFLRIADATYAGLTPAQWATMVLLLIGPLPCSITRPAIEKGSMGCSLAGGPPGGEWTQCSEI